MLTLGQKLKCLRKEHGFSQQDVANKLTIKRPVYETKTDKEGQEYKIKTGYSNDVISQPTYARMENDKTKRLPKEILDQLIDLYSIEPDYFYNDRNNLSHLPPYIREFILDPAHADLLKEIYLNYRIRLN